ncbi:MAG TPA: prephenate dehydratase domain-containing protein [Polyangiaceae bacterium]|jgi:prephenate dehydratase
MSIDRIYALGPEGTFSDVAARRFRGHLMKQRRESEIPIVYCRTIPEALERAAGDASSRAVAPIENSETGMVVATQDNLAKHGLGIEWELSVRVRYHIVSDVPLQQSKRLFVHPVAQEQCEVFIAKRMPEAEVASTRSNVDSALRWAATDPGERAAAIVPLDYAVPRAAAFDEADVQNDAQNTTRFVVVRGGATPENFANKKTSLLVEPDADRPGLLFEILSVFKKHDINLCRIESRPARTRPWAYVFYLDITNNGHSGAAVAELRAGKWNVILLGTFDALPQDP